MNNLLSQKEKDVVLLLAQAWNDFLELPEVHSYDRTEFMYAIHAAQNIVLARPAQRLLNTDDETS